MYYLPTSCLVFFFLFSLFHLLSCVSSQQQELRLCETLFQCGNITAGFPFSGENRPLACGYLSLKLHCYKNKTSIIILNHLYDVLDIDQTSNTLRLSKAELLGSFCNTTFTATTLPPETFELSPSYKHLTVFYLCDPKLPYRSSYTCPGTGPVSVSETLDYSNTCDASFRVYVPKSFVPEEKELNITNLESALSEGFEVKVKVKIDEKACHRCSSSHGICGFEDTTQVCCKEVSLSGCNILYVPPDGKFLIHHHRFIVIFLFSQLSLSIHNLHLKLNSVPIFFISFLTHIDLFDTMFRYPSVSSHTFRHSEFKKEGDTNI